MAIILGSQGISTTPTATFHGNGTGTGVLDTALLAAGWVFVEVTTAAEQGTNADVYVWRDASSRFVVAIEADDTSTGDSLKFRAAEQYNTGANTFNQPVSGSSSTTGITPTGNGTVTDTAKTINVSGHTVAEFGWVNVRCHRAGFAYMVNVNADVMTVSVQSTANEALNNSSGGTNWAMAGHYQVLALQRSVVHQHPLFLAGTLSNSTPQTVNAVGNGCSWAASAANLMCHVRGSRAPLNLAVSDTGPFTYMFDYPMPGRQQTTAAPGDTTYEVFGALSRAPKFYRAGLASPAIIHNASANTARGRGVFSGYVPGTIVFLGDGALSTGTMPGCGQTVVVNDTLYYCVGTLTGNATAAGGWGGLTNPMHLAIKSG